MELKIDPKLCIGCGACTAAGEGLNIIEMDDKTGKAKIISQPKKINDTIQMVIDICPVNAITKEE